MKSLFNQQAIVHLFLALLTSSSSVIRDGEESHFGHFRHLFDGLPVVRLKTSRGSTASIQGKHISSLVGRHLAGGSSHGNVSRSDCFVQVSGQPVYSGRFGRISPKAFRCNLNSSSDDEVLAFYHHHGNPDGVTDIVSLLILLQPLDFNSRLQPGLGIRGLVEIEITEPPSGDDERIRAERLQVPVNETSTEISIDVLNFRYALWGKNRSREYCTVRYVHGRFGFPEVGRLLKHDGSRMTQANVDCLEFVTSGLRYRHLGSESPDVDFIPLTVTFGSTRDGDGGEFQRNVWLQVHIVGGLPNRPPKVFYKITNNDSDDDNDDSDDEISKEVKQRSGKKFKVRNKRKLVQRSPRPSQDWSAAASSSSSPNSMVILTMKHNQETPVLLDLNAFGVQDAETAQRKLILVRHKDLPSNLDIINVKSGRTLSTFTMADVEEKRVGFSFKSCLCQTPYKPLVRTAPQVTLATPSDDLKYMLRMELKFYAFDSRYERSAEPLSVQIATQNLCTQSITINNTSNNNNSGTNKSSNNNKPRNRQLFTISNDLNRLLIVPENGRRIVTFESLFPENDFKDLCFGSAGSDKASSQVDGSSFTPCNWEIQLKTKLKHGRMEKNGTKVLFNEWFTAFDLFDNRMTYVHSGSERGEDRAYLKVAAGKQKMKVKLQFGIIRLDDQTPQLLLNQQLVIPYSNNNINSNSHNNNSSSNNNRAGNTATITCQHLLAMDPDSVIINRTNNQTSATTKHEDVLSKSLSDVFGKPRNCLRLLSFSEEVKYEVVEQFKFGKLIRFSPFRLDEDSSHVVSFSQLEVSSGFIRYEGAMPYGKIDEMKFLLKDKNNPPNLSRVFTFAVGSGNDSSVVPREMTKTVRVELVNQHNFTLTRKHLLPGDHVTYRVMVPPLSVGSTKWLRRGGHLSLENETRRFSQLDVDDGRVVFSRYHGNSGDYDDDAAGNISSSNVSCAEVSSHLCTNQSSGDRTILMWIEANRSSGNHGLVLSEVIKLQMIFRSSLTSAGKNKSRQKTTGDGLSINDYFRIPLRDPSNHSEIKLNEGEELKVKPGHFKATREDAIVKPWSRLTLETEPKFGRILLDGCASVTFEWNDVIGGRVTYYMGREDEIGLYPIREILSFIVHEDDLEIHTTSNDTCSNTSSSSSSHPTFRGLSNDVCANPNLNDSDDDDDDYDDGNGLSLEIEIIIAPVDNRSPELEVNAPLVVDIMGGAIPITSSVLWANDPDTNSDLLTFELTQTPAWGYLERTKLGSRSGRSQSSRRVTTFTLNDVKDKLISYAPSALSKRHRPMADQFFLYVTDGINQSPLAQVKVTTEVSMDDRLRYFEVHCDHDLQEAKGRQNDHLKTSFAFKAVVHGSSKTARSSSSSSSFQHYDRLTLYVSRPPKFGSLFLLSPPSQQQASLTTFSEIEVKKNWTSVEFLYSSERNLRPGEHEKFSLSLTDGSHMVQRSCQVPRMDRLTEPAEVERNRQLKVNFGGKKLITRFHLRVRGREVGDDVIYVLRKEPSSGELQLKRSMLTNYENDDDEDDDGDDDDDGGSKWKVLRRGDEFHQRDVNSQSLRYFHKPLAPPTSSVVLDSFTFTYRLPESTPPPLLLVSTPPSTSLPWFPECSFSVKVDLSQPAARLLITAKGAILNITSYHPGSPKLDVKLDHHVLDAYDKDSNKDDDPIFTIVEPPKLGILILYRSSDNELIPPDDDDDDNGDNDAAADDNTTNSITRFSRGDLLRSSLVYRHLSNSSVNESSELDNRRVLYDRFSFSVETKNFQSSVEKFPITIYRSVNLSSHNVNRSSSVIQVFIRPLNAVKGNVTTITTNHISFSEHVLCRILENPKHGKLLLAGKETTTFSQSDVLTNILEYLNFPDDQSASDYFLFNCTQPNNNNNNNNSSSSIGPPSAHFFNIFIRHLEQSSSPHSVTLKSSRLSSHRRLKLEVNRTPLTLEINLADGKPGFKVGGDVLKVTHPVSKADEIIFTVTKAPRFGALVFLNPIGLEENQLELDNNLNNESSGDNDVDMEKYDDDDNDDDDDDDEEGEDDDGEGDLMINDQELKKTAVPSSELNEDDEEIERLKEDYNGHNVTPDDDTSSNQKSDNNDDDDDDEDDDDKNDNEMRDNADDDGENDYDYYGNDDERSDDDDDDNDEQNDDDDVEHGNRTARSKRHYRQKLGKTKPLNRGGNIVFQVTDEGENLTSSDSLVTFKQHDVSSGRVAYVINPPFQATNTRESLVLDVHDVHGNELKGIRLLFDWSIVEIAHTQYSVCEDTGIVSIKVVRGGSQTSRSSVRVEAEQMSALEGFDYVIKSRSTVTFEPGQADETWTVELVRDDLEDEAREKFKVVLSDPTNALLGGVTESIVEIINVRDGLCEFEQPMFDNYETEDYKTLINIPSLKGNNVAQDKKHFHEEDDDDDDDDDRNAVKTTGNNIQFAAIPQVCDEETFGLLYLDLASSRMYRCDGSKWLEWRWEAGNQYLNILRDSQLPQSKKDEHGGRKGVKQYKPRIVSKERLMKTRHRPQQKLKPKPGRFGDVHCKRGWSLFERHCHVSPQEEMSWMEAEEECITLGGHLAHVTSFRHLNWLANELVQNKKFWIGLTGESLSNTWVYSSGYRPSYFNWRLGYPRYSRWQPYDSCVMVDKQLKWVNRSCRSSKVKAVCSKPAVHAEVARRNRIKEWM